ncbi:MFS transporter [Peribacillus sp. NPDC097295]|uniref:MFS transporter n=1 Tax=Peribacillus sp. NPDC097295 TaxID=3364402 RepID=UPI0037FDAE93
MNKLLKNKVFWIMLSSDMLDQISIWIRNMAVLFYIIEKTTQDPVAISLITVIEYAPIFLFSFIGGTFADRWDPKKTIINGGLLSMASILVILLFISYGMWEAVFFATFVSAIVSQFSQPSSAKVFKRHIAEDQVGSAIGIIQSLGSLFLILGPIIGTAVYSKFGISASLSLLVVTFGISTAITLFLPKTAKQEKQVHSTVLIEIKQGFHYVLHNHNLKRIAMIFCFLGLGSGLVQPLEVFLITDRLQLPRETLQWLTSTAGAGMLIGGIIAATLVNKLNVKATFVGTFVLLALSTVIEVMSTSFLLTATMRFITAFMLAFMQILLSTMMIKLVEERFIGRTNGFITPFFILFLLIGTAVSGLLLKMTSLFIVFGLSALIIALAVIPVFGMLVAPRTEKKEKVAHTL